MVRLNPDEASLWKTAPKSLSISLSLPVLAKSSMTADAMATACIVMGRDKALQYLAEQGMDGLLITRSGEIVTTDGFEDLYSLMRLK